MTSRPTDCVRANPHSNGLLISIHPRRSSIILKDSFSFLLFSCPRLPVRFGCTKVIRGRRLLHTRLFTPLYYYYDIVLRCSWDAVGASLSHRPISFPFLTFVFIVFIVFTFFFCLAAWHKTTEATVGRYRSCTPRVSSSTFNEISNHGCRMRHIALDG